MLGAILETKTQRTMYQYPTPAATLYLNPLEHGGKQFIRIWHRPDRRISRRLRESGAAKYSKTYKCYVTHRTPQAIERLHQAFQGVALVDTRYLNRPRRLRPDLGATVKGESRQAEPLGKLPDLPVVRLQPLLHGGKEVLQVSFAFDREIYPRLKDCGACAWLPEERCFALGTGSGDLHRLLDCLEGAANVWLAGTVKVRDMAVMRRLWEQTYSKDIGYLTCPLDYLEKLQLLNYSMSTIRTYHSLLVRFLNAHREQGLEAVKAFASEEINRYHRAMVQSQAYSFSLVNQSINAVKFYYQRVLGRHGLDLTQVERPEKAERLPTVLSKQEVTCILSATGNLKHRCLLQLLYAGGLRIGEVINLEDNGRAVRAEPAADKRRQGQERPHHAAFQKAAGEPEGLLPGVPAEGVALRGAPGRAVHRRQHPPRVQRLPGQIGGDQEGDAPLAAALLRHPPAGAGNEPALHPDAAGPQVQQDYRDLHPHH